MSLYTQLQTVRSEEDVKDAYIKALGCTGRYADWFKHKKCL